jgi:hypothetical protein
MGKAGPGSSGFGTRLLSIKSNQEDWIGLAQAHSRSFETAIYVF